MAKAMIFSLLASLLLFCQAAPVNLHGGSDTHCPLTVKMLDAVKGIPIGGVALQVFRQGADGTWGKVAHGTKIMEDGVITNSYDGLINILYVKRNTDTAGEVHELITDQDFIPGIYRVVFDTKAYWKAEGRTPFYEFADVVFEAHAEEHRHYTLALLISPFSHTMTAVVSKVHD